MPLPIPAPPSMLYPHATPHPGTLALPPIRFHFSSFRLQQILPSLEGHATAKQKKRNAGDSGGLEMGMIGQFYLPFSKIEPRRLFGASSGVL